MKKIIILFILLFTINGYADSIPGFLEFDISAQHWYSIYDKNTYLNTDITFKYGVSHDWFQPYLFGQMKTYFQTTESIDMNSPFRDVYSVGAGLILYKTFYIEAAHTCSHFVESSKGQQRLFDSFTKYYHNHIKIGLQFKID